MKWLWERRQPPESSLMDVAERLTTTRRGWLRRAVTGESVGLSQRETVKSWMRQLRPGRDQCVLIHRSWGTIGAVADRRPPLNVFLSDGENAWTAAPPGATRYADLTFDQVEHIMLDALTSPARPAWPAWLEL